MSGSYSSLLLADSHGGAGDEWKKSLRRSNSTSYKRTVTATAAGDENKSVKLKRSNSTSSAAAAVAENGKKGNKNRRLSVVEEEELLSSVVASLDVPDKAAKARRKSSTGSIFSVADEEDLNKEGRRKSSVSSSPGGSGFHSKSKIPVLAAHLKKIPPFPDLKSPSVIPEEEEIEVDVPANLPPGVRLIDPSGDSEFQISIYRYTKNKEEKWLVDADQLTEGDKTMIKHRACLTDWIIHLGHYFKVSQETLYHTISLIDRTLLQRSVKTKMWQLLGITSFFLAAKLEEYHPPEIKDLIKLTDNAYIENEVIEMEMILLELHDFQIYGAEPMIFVNRFLQAAEKLTDNDFKEIVICLLDGYIMSHEYSSVKSSRSAAAAVLGAFYLTQASSDNNNNDNEVEKKWNTTMEYYTEYKENELASLTILMFKTLIRALKTTKQDLYYSIKSKYSSKSTHGQILQSSYLSEENINKSIANLETQFM